jgi:hypothetical protein
MVTFSKIVLGNHIISNRKVIWMSETQQISTLIELVEKFIVLANTLLEKGIIDQDIFNKMTENKIKFLEGYKPTLHK